MAVGGGRDTIDALLKEFYVKPVTRQINEEILFLNRLESTTDGIIEGKYAVVPISVGRTSGIGPARERGPLPDAGSQDFRRATFNLKWLYGRGAVTGPGQITTQSEAGSFLRLMKVELEGLRRDLKRDLSRQVYGDGTGNIAGVASVAGQVITLDSAEPLEKGQIYIGMVLDLIQSDGVTVRSGPLTVTDFNVATPSVTVTGTIGALAATDFLARRRSVDASGHAGINGIQAVIGTGALGGLNPATAGLGDWQSIVDSSGGAFSRDKLHTVWNKVRVKSGAEPTSIITTFGVARSYFNGLQAQVQYVDPMKIEGGFRVLDFMGRPFIGDVDCPYGLILLPNEKDIKVFSTSKEFQPLDEDGHFLKWVTGYHMWEFALFRGMELGAVRRNTSAKMTGITDTGT